MPSKKTMPVLRCRMQPSRRACPLVPIFRDPTEANQEDIGKEILLNWNNEQLEQILNQLREWVKLSYSKYNRELLKWLSKLPFKTPNKYMSNSFLPFVKEIVDDYCVNGNIADEYLFMLEKLYRKVFMLPRAFLSCDLKDDIEDLREESNLELLLIHICISQADGTSHSYLAAVDFKKYVITYIDTFDGLKNLTNEDRSAMKKVELVANQIKKAKYKKIIINDAQPDQDDKFDCVFQTCLFAKCFVLNKDYHNLKYPCRKEIFYELLKGELIKNI